jgi:predicted nucleotidyltransferase
MIMRQTSKELKKIKPAIVRVLKLYGIKQAGIFGSYARGEQKKDSDVDVVIKYNGGLLKLVKIEMELEHALKKKVDVLTYRGINHLLRKRILQEEVKVL